MRRPTRTRKTDDQAERVMTSRARGRLDGGLRWTARSLVFLPVRPKRPQYQPALIGGFPARTGLSPEPEPPCPQTPARQPGNMPTAGEFRIIERNRHGGISG